MNKFLTFFLFPIFLSFNSNSAVHVKGYFKKNGTYVAPHYRSDPDKNIYNNWSVKGNINPYTGKEGTKKPIISNYQKSSDTTYNSEYDGSELIFDKTDLKDSTSHNIKYNTKNNLKHDFILDELSKNQIKQESYVIKKDIEAAKSFKKLGYSFDPNYMTSFQMQQKVKDIETSEYFKKLGYSFDPNYMTSFQMQQKVKDIETSEYFKKLGYSFDPNYMTSFQMQQKVKDIGKLNIIRR